MTKVCKHQETLIIITLHTQYNLHHYIHNML